VNKRVRHSNETPAVESNVNFTDEPEIPVAPATEEEKEQTMVTLPSKKEKKSDEAGAFSKFWNWATQLF
jgi:cell division protein FtsA